MAVDKRLDVSRVWCGSICFIGETEAFSIMHYGSKKVLGFAKKPGFRKCLECVDIYATLSSCFDTMTGKPVKFITDPAKVFWGKECVGFYNDHDIEHAPYKGKFQNQRIENFHGRLKGFLVSYFFNRLMPDENVKRLFWSTLEAKKPGCKSKVLKMSLKQRTQNRLVRDVVFSLDVFQDELDNWLLKAVEDINGLPYQKTGFLSELSISEVDVYLNFNPAIIPGTSYPGSKIIEEISSENIEPTDLAYDKALESLDMNSENFSNLLKRLREDPDGQVKLMVFGFKSILAKVEQGKGEILTELEQERQEKMALNTRLNELLMEYKETKQKLDEVMRQVSKVQAEEEIKQRRRLQRKNRVRRLPLTPIDLDFFLKFMSDTKSKRHRFLVCRLRLCLLMLFLTGLPVGDLGQFKVEHLKPLLGRKRKGRKTPRGLVVWLGKQKKMHRIPLTPAGEKLASQFEKDFKIFLDLVDKNLEARLTCNVSKPIKPIAREHLTRSLNMALKQYDTETTVYRTDSFRRGYIKHFYKSTGDLQFVSKMVGHAKIETTSQYTDLDDTDVMDGLIRYGLVEKGVEDQEATERQENEGDNFKPCVE